MYHINKKRFEFDLKNKGFIKLMCLKCVKVATKNK